MQLKRIFAGVAAAATMLGGLAVGAATAMAADPGAADEKITIQNVPIVTPAATFTAYQIGWFSNPQATAGSPTTLASVDITTNPAAVSALNTAIATVGDNSTPSKPITVPEAYKANPAAFIANTFTETQLRTLANNLTLPESTKAGQYEAPTASSTTGTISGLQPGWYFVTSNNKKIASAIVTSTYDSYTTIDRPNTSPLNTMELGTFVAKHNIPPTPTKTETTGATSVGVGTELGYKITATLPATSGNEDWNNNITFFRIHDRPSTGLTVKASEIQVKVGDKTLTNTGTKPDYTLGTTTVTKDAHNNDVHTDGAPFTGDFFGDGHRTFYINLTDYMHYHQEDAGKTVTVTYPAYVNTAAASQDYIFNDAEVGTGPWSEFSMGTNENILPVGKFAFTKIGVGDDVNGLAGAEFSIKQGDTTLSFVKEVAADGTAIYRNVTDASSVSTDALVTDDTTTTTIVSPANGKIEIRGVAAGTYKVQETKAPSGYMQSTLPTFTVAGEVTAGTTKPDTISWKAQESTKWGLVSQNATSGTVTVTNIKSITQLPLTGAAGITMLVVVALLIGGAAVLIAVRSHSLKIQLRG